MTLRHGEQYLPGPALRDRVLAPAPLSRGRYGGGRGGCGRSRIASLPVSEVQGVSAIATGTLAEVIAYFTRAASPDMLAVLAPLAQWLSGGGGGVILAVALAAFAWRHSVDRGLLR